MWLKFKRKENNMAWIIEDTYDGEQYIADIVKKSGSNPDPEIIYTKIKEEAQ